MASKPPWDKPACELSKFDWLTAVGLHPAHRDKPTDLRIAQELTRFTNGKSWIAWPTVQTLADYVGCHRVTAQRAISNLRDSGAIAVIKISELPEELKLQNNIRRSGRGNAYGPNKSWAAGVFASREHYRKVEPCGLKKGRLNG